jgi:hypothetical protein
MGRIVFVLPLCLLLQGQRGIREAIPMEPTKELRIDPGVTRPIDLSEKELIANACVALAPATGFPGCIPWSALYPIGNKGLFTLENILAYQPTLFLQMCLDKYEAEIHGYTCVFYKQERVQGKLRDPEKIDVAFREKPFSVHFAWQSGQVLARKALYVEGENEGNMRVLPTFLPFAVNEKPDSARSKASGHYTINQFGMRMGTQRSLASMRRAQARGGLHVEYLGEYSVSQLGGRQCYKFVRTPFDTIEEYGLNELTLYIDKENWLQVGSILKDAQGNLISEYFFGNVHLNPDYSKDQFSFKGF